MDGWSALEFGGFGLVFEVDWLFWTGPIDNLWGGVPPLMGAPANERRTHSPEFKARVAVEAISGRKTIQEIAADHYRTIAPVTVTAMKAISKNSFTLTIMRKIMQVRWIAVLLGAYFQQLQRYT